MSVDLLSLFTGGKTKAGLQGTKTPTRPAEPPADKDLGSGAQPWFTAGDTFTIKVPPPSPVYPLVRHPATFENYVNNVAVMRPAGYDGDSTGLPFFQTSSANTPNQLAATFYIRTGNQVTTKESTPVPINDRLYRLFTRSMK